MGHALVMTKDETEAMRAHCERIARSGLVPEHFSKNPLAIYTAISMAKALGEVPETLMQNIYFIGGRAGLSSAYMLSRLQRTHAIRGTVRYVTTGEGATLSVRALAVDAETGETVEGPAATMAMAKAEGWTKNPKYTSMPEVMLRKRAVAFLARDHYPGALMGYLTVEEAEDIAPRRHAGIIDATPSSGAIAAINDEIEDAPTDAELAAADREVVS
jgi:hypothetical protein